MQVTMPAELNSNQPKSAKSQNKETQDVANFESLMFQLTKNCESKISEDELDSNFLPQDVLLEPEKTDELSFNLFNQLICFDSSEPLNSGELKVEILPEQVVNQMVKKDFELSSETELTLRSEELELEPVHKIELPTIQKKELKNVRNVELKLPGTSETNEMTVKPTEHLMTVSSFHRLATLKEKSDEPSINQVITQPVVSSVNLLEPTPVEEVASIIKWENQGEIETEILKNASLLKENESSRLVLKMFPRELGSLHIELQLKDGVLSGLIQVEQVKTAELLQHASQELNQILQHVEIKVADVINENQHSFLNQHFDQSNSGQQNEQKQMKRSSSQNHQQKEDLVQEMVSDESHQINLTV